PLSSCTISSRSFSSNSSCVRRPVSNCPRNRKYSSSACRYLSSAMSVSVQLKSLSPHVPAAMINQKTILGNNLFSNPQLARRPLCPILVQHDDTEFAAVIPTGETNVNHPTHFRQ